MREEILDRVMRLTSFYALGGDYLEFGVDKGKSFIVAYHMAQRYGMNNMQFYAFDSFEGLPEIAGIDRDVPQFKKGNLRAHRINLKRICVVHELILNALPLFPAGMMQHLITKPSRNCP
ncbi:MAG: methyltransferase [Parcubacteria group bacterium Gr01-1014_66]|nr:MAG: methyltransferase [Parcubacteria group bacterium Gr01-1014_66]